MNIANDRMLEDGLYEVDDDVEVIEIGERLYDIRDFSDEYAMILFFIENHPNFVVANAYETSSTILLSRKPNIFKGYYVGSGFNYGSTNLVENCPKRLLILAEDD